MFHVPATDRNPKDGQLKGCRSTPKGEKKKISAATLLHLLVHCVYSSAPRTHPPIIRRCFTERAFRSHRGESLMVVPGKKKVCARKDGKRRSESHLGLGLTPGDASQLKKSHRQVAILSIGSSSPRHGKGPTTSAKE